MSKNISINSYNELEKAKNYDLKRGFDPKRKEEMLHVTLSAIIELTTKGSTLLELGSGSGLFTKSIIESDHFSEIHVTDGARAMLEIAKRKLSSPSSTLNYSILDFTQNSWSKSFDDHHIQAVTSSMAIHHAENKTALFNEVFQVLKPGGIFVFADHIAGSSSLINQIIANKRAKLKLGSKATAQQIENFIVKDNKKQEAEGNKCESVMSYLNYLQLSDFTDVDCLWRDYWLAVFVAKKPEE